MFSDQKVDHNFINPSVVSSLLCDMEDHKVSLQWIYYALFCLNGLHQINWLKNIEQFQGTFRHNFLVIRLNVILIYFIKILFWKCFVASCEGKSNKMMNRFSLILILRLIYELGIKTFTTFVKIFLWAQATNCLELYFQVETWTGLKKL